MATLPYQGDKGSKLLDYRNDPERDKSIEIRVIEGGEYRYKIISSTIGNITIDRQELFAPDDLTGYTGRLKPGLNVGGLPVNFYVNGHLLGSVKIEIISKKFNYLLHYRWMLRDISMISTEIIMRHFAPTIQTFSPSSDYTHSAQTIYQRFAFLHSYICSTQFEVAIAQILSQPKRSWVDISYKESIIKGVKGSSNIIKALTKDQDNHGQIQQ